MANKYYLNYIHYYKIWLFCITDKPIKKINPIFAMNNWSECKNQDVRTNKDFRKWIVDNNSDKNLILNKTYPFMEGHKYNGYGSRPVKITPSHRRDKNLIIY